MLMSNQSHSPLYQPHTISFGYFPIECSHPLEAINKTECPCQIVLLLVLSVTAKRQNILQKPKHRPYFDPSSYFAIILSHALNSYPLYQFI